MANLCPKCGFEINQNVTQCPMCGASLDGETGSNQDSQNNHQKKQLPPGCIPIIIVVVFLFLSMFGFIGLFLASEAPKFEESRSERKEKTCYSNQRVLLGAVEMYNMDNVKMMTTLDIPTLVKQKYLKQEPIGSEPQCSYSSEGDLSKDGIITCKYHGSVPITR